MSFLPWLLHSSGTLDKASIFLKGLPETANIVTNFLTEQMCNVTTSHLSATALATSYVNAWSWYDGGFSFQNRSLPVCKVYRPVLSWHLFIQELWCYISINEWGKKVPFYAQSLVNLQKLKSKVLLYIVDYTKLFFTYGKRDNRGKTHQNNTQQHNFLQKTKLIWWVKSLDMKKPVAASVLFW